MQTTNDRTCEVCGSGFLLPSGRCDHCNTEHPAEVAITESDWFPWWKKPVLMSEWEQIEVQALISARMTTETHDRAKATDMPFFFVEIVARNKYRSRRRYFRIKWRIENMKSEGALALLHAISGSGSPY